MTQIKQPRCRTAVKEQSDIDAELQTLFPPWIIEDTFIPKVNNAKLGYTKGEPFIKKREVQFNPNSRKHIEYCLRQKYNWKPKVFTPSGDAKIDESVSWSAISRGTKIGS